MLFKSAYLKIIYRTETSLIGCQEDKNGKFRKKRLKKNLLKNHKAVDESVTFHVCLGCYPLH